MKSIALFCGSSSGINGVYSDAAKDLTRIIFENNYKIITGGGHVGVMGIIADQMLELGGHITGVIPEFLVKKEVGHKGLSELFVVDSMHQRKKKIETLADAFIALPGGFGTLDELFEIITWAQLSLHNKPCCIFNVNGFFDNVIKHIHHMVNEGFVHKDYLDLLVIEKDPSKLIKEIMNFQPREVDKAKIALKQKSGND